MKKTEPMFTREKFDDDIRQCANQIINKGALIAKNVDIKFQISSNISTSATQTGDLQFTIFLNTELIKSVWDDGQVCMRSYWNQTQDIQQLSEEAFLRMVCVGALCVAIQHEYWHILRAHRELLKVRTFADNPERVVENDADIYAGAGFAVQCYALTKGKPAYTCKTAAEGYVLSIFLLWRVFPEVLSSAETKYRKHPHSVQRAIATIGFGVTSEAFEKLSPIETQEFRAEVRKATLLSAKLKILDIDEIEKHFSNLEEDASTWILNKQIIDSSALWMKRPLTMLQKFKKWLRKMPSDSAR